MKAGKKPSPKRKALLKAGKKLIFTKGYNATSIDEICEQAEVTKGSFFYYFESKEQYVVALLAHVWSPILKFWEKDSTDNHPPLDYLREHINTMLKFIKGDGRLMRILWQELSQTSPAMRDLQQSYFNNWMTTLTRDVERARAVHNPNADFEVEGVVDLIVSTLESSPFITRMRGAKNVEAAIAHLFSYLDYLFQAHSEHRDS